MLNGNSIPTIFQNDIPKEVTNVEIGETSGTETDELDKKIAELEGEIFTLENREWRCTSKWKNKSRKCIEIAEDSSERNQSRIIKKKIAK